MAVLGVGRVLIGLVAPCRFKILDSQPEKSNMGPISTDAHDFWIFPKKLRRLSGPVFVVFSAWSSHKIVFSRFLVETKKLRDEKLCRFVVVSPREVPYSTFSCPFKIFNFRTFLKAPPLRLSQSRESSVH